jgi:phosphoglycerate dehydrogenase-like enzyme
MPPETERRVLDPAARARLAALCMLPDPRPLAAWDEPRTATLMARAEVLITGWYCPPIPEAVLAAAPRLRLIAHTGGTVKGLVPLAAWARGIAVTNAVAANARPVAEWTLAMILLAGKQAFAAREAYRTQRRRWPQGIEWDRIGNRGRVVGLVGASRIGRLVLDLLRPFEFRVLLHDPTLDDAAIRALGAEPAALDDLVGRADIVSLHAPSLPATRHMMDARRIGLMRPGAVLINTARGALLDHAAAARAVADGRITLIADTLEPEPLPPDHVLWDLPGAFLTPHIAGSIGTEVARMAEAALDEIERHARGEELRHAVRQEELEVVA